MFEQYDFDYLIERMLSNISDNFDKREGSVIYDAVAPAALELANFYTILDMVMEEVFADSASYYYLVKRAAERGLFPKEETYAVGKMVVSPAECTVTAGDRFNMDDLNYEVTGPVEGVPGAYKVLCETAGAVGNQQLGTLLPIEYIEGLESAELTEILIPGEDEEDVEAFRVRYFESFSEKSFGGNKADYKSKVNSIDGVGGCKIIRAWNGGISPSSLIPDAEVGKWFIEQSETTVGKTVFEWLKAVHSAAEQKLFTVGGKVKAVIITSEFKSPSNALIDNVQEVLDPSGKEGEGDGIVPIGHVVNVSGVQNTSIDFVLSITYKQGYAFSDLKAQIENVIDSYFLELRQEWAESENLVVRVSQVETRVLTLEGVEDISHTQINGKEENLVLDSDCIPVRGEVVG